MQSHVDMSLFKEGFPSRHGGPRGFAEKIWRCGKCLEGQNFSDGIFLYCCSTNSTEYSTSTDISLSKEYVEYRV